MPETPQHVGSRVDWAINHLNAHWDLGLPRLHGRQAKELEKDQGSCATKCFSRIRYLCFRVEIEGIVSDFNERARQLCSKWKWKPSQEKGTIPVLPVTKSFLARDIQEKRNVSPIRLTTRQRADLLELLFGILNEQFELARLSESFSHERPSSTSFNTAPTTPQKSGVSRDHEQIVTPTRQNLRTVEPPMGNDEPQLKNPMTGSAKRSIASPTSRNKRQQTFREFPGFQSASSADIAPFLSSRLTLPHEATSFDTVHTAGASSVFTSADVEDDVFSSTDTSMLSVRDWTQKTEQYDGPSTQDYHETIANGDEEMRRSFGASHAVPVSTDLIHEALEKTFKRRAQLPAETPFWLCWEICRLADILGRRQIDLYRSIGKSSTSKEQTFENFWAAAKQLCRDQSQPLPQKSEIPKWMNDKNEYEDSVSNKAVYLTANLEWAESLSDGLFTMRPNEIRLEKSCRLYRKYGADRFLVVFAPLFSKHSYPKKLREAHNDEHALRQKITGFLTRGRHFIAGRYWRVFYVEPEKNKNRKKDQSPRQKFSMFAESGYDMLSTGPQDFDLASLKVSGRHQTFALDDVAQWHMPFAANINSTDLKLFSRWGIGLSRTIPTTVLRQHEFLLCPDPAEGEVMDDGCALMSLPLARAIWQACGAPGDSLPSAVQGRISGAKGLWIVDYAWENRYPDISDRGYWIEVSDTQLKINPHPRDRHDADDYLRTFEVLKFAGKCKPGHLNMQLITILEDNGVPRTVLAEALRTDTRAYSESVRTAIQDPTALLRWIGENGLFCPSDGQKILGSFPVERRQQLRLLLESGFDPANCARIIRCMRHSLRDYMLDYTERLWITLPHSTSVFCIPDPLGVLKEDEVCFNASEAITDPRTGLSEFMLADADVLVARVPAYLSSDIQKRKAVYRYELRHYKNVIIFPTRGDKPLASMLSGGDYDGDTCWVCWDLEIVVSFKNHEVPPLPKPDQCGMSQHSRPISDMFKSDSPSRDAMDDFLAASVDFNARPNLLGSCSTEHERLIYSLCQKNKVAKLSDPKAVKLAALAGYLVDCNKQGWSLDEDAWHKVRKYSSGPRQLPEPAYKSGVPPRTKAGVYANVIDELKFRVAEEEKNRVLADFEMRTKDMGTYDEVLSRYWKTAWRPLEKKDDVNTKVEKETGPTKAGSGKLRGGVQQPGERSLLGLKEILEGLLHDVKAVQQLVRDLGFERFDSSPDESKDLRNYNAAVQKVYEQYQAIVPRDVDHDLRRRYEEETDYPFPHWSLLRASCLHRHVCSKGGFPGWVWHVAGRELCYLKTFYHPGQPSHVTKEIHDCLKVNTKYVKSLLERKAMDVDELDGDDIIGDEMMGRSGLD
ncbi:RNA-directed RNA polymerase [Exophiala viscosa]|uniref:RNA-dependent RNA polymerase n=1 Tax=Exophiala viscosa TaxID=2486360 RepID=A0AAN6IFK7_9EURO|nr:RNA-directed RNA polymerase [Exophiala viscosa]